MFEFLKELRRRRVFRVAGAYMVMGWLIVQVVDVVGKAARMPEWTDTFTLIILMAGFPVVLFVGWAFDFTPEGLKRTETVTGTGHEIRSAPSSLDYVIIGALVFVGGLIAWQAFMHRDAIPPAEAPTIQADTGDIVSVVTPASQPAPAPEPAVEAPELSVAVLPFAAFSADENDGFFADGLTEEILNSLASIPELLVTSRTSAFQFRGEDIPAIPEIAQSLGVAHVLEGSVRRAGDRVRITAQLIRASDDRHLWSQTYDRSMEDVFAIQEDIAENVAGVLRVVLDDERRARMRNSGTGNIDAFIAYQQGADLWNRAHEEADYDLLERANPFFERATELAPEYSEAYLLQSDYYSHQLVEIADADPFDQAEFDRLMARQDELLELARNAASSGARTAMVEANQLLFSDDWTRAPLIIGNALRATECAHDNWLQALMNLYGDLNARLRYARHHIRCDPLNVTTISLLGETYLTRGDYEDALAIAEQLAHMGAVYESEFIVFEALLGLQRLDDATAMLEESWEWERMRLAAMNPDQAASRAILEPFLGSGDWFELVVLAMMGDREEANTLAATIDARPLGALTLIDIVVACRCGAPFDLEATPNFAMRLAQADFPWPPAGDLGFVHKDW